MAETKIDEEDAEAAGGEDLYGAEGDAENTVAATAGEAADADSATG